MRTVFVLFLVFLIVPTIIHAQTDIRPLLTPMDFLDPLENAETSNGSNYILELQQIGAQEQTPKNPSLTAAEQSAFATQGYVIRRMENRDQPASIRLTLDTTERTFDIVPDKKNVMDPSTITVSTADTTGYELVAVLEQELKTASGQIIPITNCDDGCTSRIAASWTQEGAYGWGYTLSGAQVPADFLNNNWYRTLVPGEYTILAQAHKLAGKESTKLSFAIYPSKNQPLGTYRAPLRIVAIPW